MSERKTRADDTVQRRPVGWYAEERPQVGPDEPEPDVVEQHAPAKEPWPARRSAIGEEEEERWAAGEEVDVEAPEADIAEQHTPVSEEEQEQEEESSRGAPRTRFDVDEADLADQERTVELDEDDYR